MITRLLQAISRRLSRVLFGQDTIDSEFFLLFGLLVWAWILLIAYPNLLSGTSYTSLALVAPQEVWGFIFLGTSVAVLLGVATDLLWVRAGACLAMVMLWGFVAASFYQSNSVPTGQGIYTVLAAMAFFAFLNNVRRMREERESTKLDAQDAEDHREDAREAANGTR